MKIAVLGAGNAGCAVAGDLTLKGHEVTLIKSSRSVHDDNFEYLCQNGGQTRTAHISKVTTDLACLSDAEVVIIYIQTSYHEELIMRIKEYLRDGQIVETGKHQALLDKKGFYYQLYTSQYAI